MNILRLLIFGTIIKKHRLSFNFTKIMFLQTFEKSQIQKNLEKMQSFANDGIWLQCQLLKIFTFILEIFFGSLFSQADFVGKYILNKKW